MRTRLKGLSFALVLAGACLIESPVGLAFILAAVVTAII